MNEEVKTIKRGEMWYIANPKTPALGRPGIVLSNEKGCAVAPDIAVVWVTTNTFIGKNRENVRLRTPKRESVARCGCVAPVPRNQFQYVMCDISAEEMQEIEKAIHWALDFKTDETENDLTVIKERDLYKTLYFEVLRELAKKQIEAELPVMVELEREAAEYEEPEEELVEEIEEVVEVEEDDEPEENPVVIIEPAPVVEDWEDDFPESLEKPEPKKRKKKAKSSSGTKSTNKKKVNINKVTAHEIQCSLGFGRETAESIVSYRHRNGRFTCMDDLAKVRRMGKKNMEKLEGRIEF